MNRQKKLLVFSSVIVIISLSVLYFAYNMFLQTRVADERLELVQNIHKEKLLIGLNYKECEEMLGPLKFEKENA